MWGFLRKAAGFLLAASAVIGWLYHAFGLAADVVSMPEDAKDIQDAFIAILQKFAEAPGWAIYPILLSLLAVGLALLFGWHPEKGWGWHLRKPSVQPLPAAGGDTAALPPPLGEAESERDELRAHFRELAMATRWEHRRESITKIWLQCIESGENILKLCNTVDDYVVSGEYRIWRSGLNAFFFHANDFIPNVMDRVQSGVEDARSDAEATAIILVNLRRLEHDITRGGPHLDDLSIFYPE